MGKRWSDIKKRRCISEIKKRLKIHKPMKALKLVSNTEDVPVKTLEDWFYKWKKEETRQKAALEKNENRYRGTCEDPESSVGRFGLERLPYPPRPVIPPYLVTDRGQYSCSRCNSTSHLEEVEGGYFCSICEVHLLYEEQEDVEIKYRESPYKINHWMA